MTPQEIKVLQDKLAAIEAENAALKARPVKAAAPFTLRVSAKGAVSVYGLGRFPVTLYASQWDRVLTRAPEIRAFIAANADKLAKRPE